MCKPRATLAWKWNVICPLRFWLVCTVHTHLHFCCLFPRGQCVSRCEYWNNGFHSFTEQYAQVKTFCATRCRTLMTACLINHRAVHENSRSEWPSGDSRTTCTTLWPYPSRHLKMTRLHLHYKKTTHWSESKLINTHLQQSIQYT